MRIRVHNILETKDLRRRLRKEETAAEKVLWAALRNRKLSGEKFTRQHGIGSYVADFHCSKYRLAVEVDGGIHLRKDVAERDKIRSEFIEAWDITVLRVTNEDVLNDLPGVLERIRGYLR